MNENGSREKSLVELFLMQSRGKERNISEK
jgi:hypothetical protein